MQQVKRLRLEDQVLFLGRFAREDLEAAYEAADLFVLRLVGRGAAAALLEAMARGRCVVTTMCRVTGTWSGMEQTACSWSPRARWSWPAG